MEKAARSSKKEAREEKLRDQKLEEIVLKSLDECPSLEEKLQFLLRKHLDSEKKVLALCNDLKANQRNFDVHLREKEQMQRELNKSVLMRDKLQEVCREQQKIIKSVKNESLLKIREEEERRKESQYKFQTSLNEITQSLSKNNEENLKLRDYNVEMTKKLKYLAEQYQTREKQLEKLNEQVQLESQLHQAKLNKVQVEAAMEKEILTKENQIGLEKLLQAQRQVKELSEREQELKKQLNVYTAKYDEFQKSLQKSNEIFVTYKAELEKMSKHTKKFEKDALTWRAKYEKSNAMLIELATEKQLRDEHAERCNKQVDQLQKLLRALQGERSNLHKTLRDNNIEIPPMPELPQEPEPMKIEPINSDKDKMELMSRNCAQLKETLANLQSQMKLLSKTESKESIKSTTSAAATAEAAAKQLQQQEKAEEAARVKKQKKKNKKAQKKASKAGQGDGITEQEGTNIENAVDVEAAETLTEAEADTSEAVVQIEAEKSTEAVVPIEAGVSTETPLLTETTVPVEVEETSVTIADVQQAASDDEKTEVKEGVTDEIATLLADINVNKSTESESTSTKLPTDTQSAPALIQTSG